MTHYVAIVEDEPGRAVGIWFPDLPGCFSAGDSVEEAMANARDAVALWADLLAEDGKVMPDPRSVSEIKADPDAAEDVSAYLLALIPFAPRLLSAAE